MYRRPYSSYCGLISVPALGFDVIVNVAVSPTWIGPLEAAEPPVTIEVHESE